MNPRLMAFVLCACALIGREFSTAGCQADEPAAGSPLPVSLASITEKFRSGEPVVVATFGDSITWPCYHTDFQQNYITFAVDALRQAYPKADIRIVHAGNMGSAARGLGETRFDRYVLAHAPDLVVIMFGMNDCLGGEGAIDAYEQNLTRLIERARSRGVLPVIANQNEIIYDSPDGQPRRALPRYMARALEVAVRERVPAADCFAAWKPLLASRDELAARLNDWIHPNHAGHRLMARSILQSLWPEAVGFVSDAVRTPERLPAADPVARLLPGPPGKQILRTSDGIWCAVSGRSRDGRITDLVFSWSEDPRPAWADFEHITLIGTGKEAVFDAMDRTLTAGLLLEREGRVLVVFSWNVGVFVVSIDLRKVSWQDHIRDPSAWLAQSGQPFVRPQIVVNNQQNAGLLHDAWLQPDGWPAVFCSARKPAPGSGWEITDGEDGIALVTRRGAADESVQDFLFPGFQALRCTHTGAENVYWAAQRNPGEEWRLGTVGRERFFSVHRSARELLLPGGGIANQAVGVAYLQTDQAADGHWTILEWGEDFSSHDLSPPAGATPGRLVPLPWSDGVERGIEWREVPHDDHGKCVCAWQSQLPPGGATLGILTEHRGQLAFSITGVRRTIPSN